MEFCERLSKSGRLAAIVCKTIKRYLFKVRKSKPEGLEEVGFLIVAKVARFYKTTAFPDLPAFLRSAHKRAVVTGQKLMVREKEKNQ